MEWEHTSSRKSRKCLQTLSSKNITITVFRERRSGPDGFPQTWLNIKL